MLTSRHQSHFGSIRTFQTSRQNLFRALGLRNAKDTEIFARAKSENVILMSKDADFQKLLKVHGAPPQVIWITCGNTSNERLKTILSFALPKAMALLNQGESLVEISDNTR